MPSGPAALIQIVKIRVQRRGRTKDMPMSVSAKSLAFLRELRCKPSQAEPLLTSLCSPHSLASVSLSKRLLLPDSLHVPSLPPMPQDSSSLKFLRCFYILPLLWLLTHTIHLLAPP